MYPKFLKDISSLWAILLFGLILCDCDDSDDNSTFVEDFNTNVQFIRFKNLGIQQSMSFYDGKALFVAPVDNRLIAHVFDIKEGTQISEIELPVPDGFSVPHANSSCLGNRKISDLSIFPVLYLSAWNNGRHAFVYDISQDKGIIKGRLIQIIDPSNVSLDIIGAGYLDWVVDNSLGLLYSIAYHIKGSASALENNYTHVTQFNLPSLDNSVVVLSDDDVVDYFTVPLMPFFQDKFLHDGHIFVVAGMPTDNSQFPPRLFDIDTKTKQLSYSELPLNGEPEGFCYYSGHKWLNMYGHNIVYNIDYLLGK